MGFEKGATYGTFDGSQSFPQSSAPLLPGTFGSGGHVQYPVVPGTWFSSYLSLAPICCFRSRFRCQGMNLNVEAIERFETISSWQG